MAELTSSEEVLVRIWSRVLNRADFTVTEDFFQLGGTSVAALRVVAEVERETGARLAAAAPFRHRTVGSLAAVLDGLSAAEPSPDPGGGAHRRPLTREQSALIFMQRTFGDRTPVYHMPLVHRAAAGTDVRGLAGAVDAVVARHVALGSALVEENGTLWFEDVADVRCRILELTHSVPSAAERRLDAIVKDTCRRPFRLGEPLFRATAVSMPDGSVVLVAATHHVVFDGGSTALFRRDLAMAYSGATLEPGVSRLGGVPIEPSEAAKDYWRSRFRDPVAPLDLVPEATPDILSGRGDQRDHDWSPRLPAMRALAGRLDLPVGPLLVASFALVLGRYASRHDLVVATAFAARHRTAVADEIGMNVRTLPIRVDVAESATTTEFVRHVHSRMVEALEHSDVSFDQIVELARVPRDPTRPPLAQVMVVVNEMDPRTPAEPGALRLVPVRVPLGVSRFDLGVSFALSADTLTCSVEYRTDLFDAAFVDTLVEHWGRLLDSAFADTGGRVGDLRMLSAAEESELLRLSTGRAVRVPDGSLWTLVHGVAQDVGDAVAVRTDDDELSYAELVDQARRYAAALSCRDVGAGDVVGLLLPRGPAVVVVMLAISCLGAATFPVPPDVSPEMAEELLSSTGAALLVTDREGFDVATPHVTPRELAADQGSPASWSPGHAPGPDDVAMVMATSGTTGKPKTIALTNRNILSFVADPDFDVDHEVVVFHAPHAFDAATYEIWVPLVRGHTVFVAPDGRLDAAEYRALIARSGATAFHATAGLFRTLARIDPSCFLGLRTVLTGGDVVPAASVASVLAACADITVRHQYGPTETTSFSTTLFVRGDDELDPVRPLPLGYPTAGTRVYVLDDHLRPVPFGQAGELCIGGPGVAAGYLSASEDERARFVPDPFVGDDARLYRTGDIGFWGERGLHFLGRSDDQVKVNGYRVELRGLEATARRLREVADAAAAVVTGPRGDRQVGLVVVPPEGVRLDAETARSLLGRVLPAHLVPARVEVADTLSLTDNGKVDRRVPRETPSVRTGDGVAPSPTVTARLTAVLRRVREVLGRDDVRAEDNFFTEGGTSLTAMELVAKLAADGVACSVRDVYLWQTGAGIAGASERSEAEALR